MDTNSKIIYPKLSYDIVGILFKIHSELGGYYQEKYYKRAVEKSFIKNQITHKNEIQVDLTFEDEKIGKYFLDFLVEDKLILELKAVPKLFPNDFKQVSAYLRASTLKLGILANFHGRRLKYYRILNSAVRI